MVMEDDEMVEMALMGNADAFGGLVRKYEKPIFNLMYRTTGSLDAAADLTQDAFLKAFDKLHTYRPGRKFYSWLYALAVNTARDHLRRDRRQPVITDHNPEIAPAGGATDNADDVQSLLEIMRSLPVHDREAVLMRFREGLKMKEIAERLDLSVSGAKMRVQRGLAKLRTAWETVNHGN
ncbi:MAG: RNA polymerase sigma factor [Desulfobacterales bacterium]